MAYIITEVFYPKTRKAWRSWLRKNHQKKSEIWVQKYRKASGKPSIAYDDLVEECLCFGWIDGVVKKNCEDGSVQRITPRRKKTFLSELNRQRVWKLQALDQITDAGIAPIADQIGSPDDPWEFPDWVKSEIKKDQAVWDEFMKFNPLYQRLKIGWITEPGKRRRAESERRLAYLIRMTGQGKQYGTIPIPDHTIFHKSKH